MTSPHQSPVTDRPFLLEDILVTKQLRAPSTRTPDFQQEIDTIYNLAQVMADSPDRLIDALLQAGLDLCHAGTAGLSLLETTPEGEQIFRWTNLAGTLVKLVGGWTPGDFSPCNVCLARNSPQLFAWPARYFEYLKDKTDVPIAQVLMIPIYLGAQSPGTIWIISHDEAVHFDREDVRIMKGLAEFTASSLRLTQSLQFQTQAREQAENESAKDRRLAVKLKQGQVELEGLVKSGASELRRLSAELFSSQDEERRRIARDLHDSTGQKLAALIIDLDLAQRAATKLQAPASEALGKCFALAKEISDEIRSLSYLLHPPLLDELGIVKAVAWYAEGINKRKGLQVRLEADSKPVRLPSGVEIALFRVVQAALSNVHLHSGSKTATVRIAQDGEKLILEIIDHGHGFRPELLTQGDSTRRIGVGLLGMKERLQLIGGRLEVETGTHGTILRSVVPISPRGAKPS